MNILLIQLTSTYGSHLEHAGNHIGHTLEDKPGLILKDILIIEEVTLYLSRYNTTTQGSTDENI